MDTQALDNQSVTSWERNYRLLHHLCRSYMARAKSYGLNVEYDDLFQEAALAYTLAQRTYDPRRNFKFTTYMGRAAVNRLGRYLAQELDRRRHQMELGAPAEDETQLEQLEALGAQEVDDVAEYIDRDMHRKAMYERLSPMARKVLEILEDPPEEIRSELVAHQEKAKLARAQGRNARSYSDVTFAFLAKHILPMWGNMSRVTIYSIRNELIRYGQI